MAKTNYELENAELKKQLADKEHRIAELEAKVEHLTSVGKSYAATHHEEKKKLDKDKGHA